MLLSARQFAEKLNKHLDETGVPGNTRERTTVLSKLLDIPKQLAYSLLSGHQLPDDLTIRKITDEFEVDL